MVEQNIPRKPQSSVGQPRRFLRSAGVLILLLIFATGATYAWQFLNRPCQVDDVQEASAFLISQMRQYDDVYMSTAAAPTRKAITYPITVMQQILVDTQQIEVPACMRRAKIELIDYMGDAIRAFRAYEAQEQDAVIKGWLDSSHAHIRVFIKELDTVQSCAPNCIRLQDLLPSP